MALRSKKLIYQVAGKAEIDRWILSSLNTVVKKVNQYMDDYEPTGLSAIEDFVG